MFGTNSLKGRLQRLRITGWIFVGGGALFTVLTVVALMHARVGDNWPWWSIFFGPTLGGIGYGIQRTVRFVLEDPDWNNMFASKDSELQTKINNAIAELDRGERVRLDVENLKHAGRDRLHKQSQSSP
jgi:hypothetical protein